MIAVERAQLATGRQGSEPGPDRLRTLAEIRSNSRTAPGQSDRFEIAGESPNLEPGLAVGPAPTLPGKERCFRSALGTGRPQFRQARGVATDQLLQEDDVGRIQSRRRPSTFVYRF